MPAHNTAPFISTAIGSALGQTVEDIELLVIDDGSSDGTADAAEQAGAGDPRLRVLRNPAASGPSAARNRGMEAARGAFFAFLDSDDEWLPRFLEVQLDAFRAFPHASVVNGNAVSVGGPLDGRPYRVPHARRPVPLVMMIEQEATLSIMSVIRREVFEQIGGFDTALRRNEDYEFWLRAAVAGFQFIQTGEPLVRYRRRESGLSADELRMVDGIITVFRRARQWCAGRPRELAAIDRQIARFDRESLALRAKSALRRRDFDEAGECFRALNARYPRLSHAAMALASRVAPRGLWWADRVRRART
jgi:glycosyltransferase involved in cell wall biosynthesis